MITVNIKGGLGNQMFQYAAGRALAIKNDNKLRLVRDERSGDISRPFSLLNFNIKAEVAMSEAVPSWMKLASRIRQKFTGDFKVAFDPRVLEERGSAYLDGYYQSERYFESAAATIREDFTLKEPLPEKARELAETMASDQNSISLHVRRGDYITHPDFGGIVTPEYYERAVASIRANVTDAHFYVFSDDIDWCRQELSLGKATFVSDPELKDHEELVLMSRCQHHVIANSSFSWWGAWLGRNPNKIVIAPKRWSNLHESWYRDIIPSSWTRL